MLGEIGHLHLKKGCYAEAAVTLQHCMRTFEANGKFVMFLIISLFDMSVFLLS